VRPLLIDEAARRRRIETRVMSRLEKADYAEVVLPIIDFVDAYVNVADRDAAKQSYRFVDREGEMVAIRSDFTPMLARVLAPVMRADELPLRLFYRGDVIRYEASRLGTNREIFQIGAEIVGASGIEADIEMLTLADIVRDFGLQPIVVYNDVSIAESLAARATGVREALVAKRMSDDVPQELRDVVARLIGGEAKISDVAPFAPEAAERLEKIVASLGSEFILQLDDIDDKPGYYTGIRFRVYAGAPTDAASRATRDSARTGVAQGGRYDHLYERFGTAAAAIGFTFTIDELERKS
jgi:ATP phosphoribosyltransferase regulatory subunit